MTAADDGIAARRIIFWRHGRTAWNAVGRYQGHTDIPLDDLGRAQAVEAAPYVARLQPEVILASDLARARVTAEAVASVTGLPVRTDPRLRETNMGRWEGLTFAEVGERFPVDQADWRAGRTPVPNPTAEARLDVARRVVAALQDSTATQPLVVSHGGAIRATLCLLLGLAEPDWRVLSPLGNCRWSILERARGGWSLAQHNAGADGVPDDHAVTAVDDGGSERPAATR